MPEEAKTSGTAESVPVNTEYERTSSMYEQFRRTAEMNRSMPAVIFWNRRFTYQALLRMIDSLAASIKTRFGASKGDRIGIFLPNSPQFVIAIYAASKIGCVGVPVNHSSSVREIENVVRHSGMKVLIVSDGNAEKVKHLSSKDLHIAIARNQDFVSFGTAFRWAFRRGLNYIDGSELDGNTVKLSDLILENPDSGFDEDLSSEDTALLAYSGSTSTEPRAAALTQRNIYSSTQYCRDWFPKIERKTVTIAAVPFHHVFALVLGLLVPLASGSTTVLIEDHRDTENVLGSITDHLCDYFVGNPSIFKSLMENRNILRYRLNTVKVFISGGDTISEEFAKKFEDVTGSGIVTTYGTKEVTGVSHINPLDRRKRKYGSIGILVGNTESRILDEDTGADVSPGSKGILAIRGSQVMPGYWHNDDATNEVLKDGWFLTDDTARMDSDGFYYIYERRRESIVSDSSTVSAAEVEEVLRQNPRVGEVAVIGIPDERKGEIVKAYISPKEGEKVSEKELRELCEAQLSEYKRPSVYDFRKELPKNMEGQVIKRILKEESQRESGA